MEVKSWVNEPPSCGAARPSSCVACGAPSRVPGKALVIVGHGLRERGVEGPLVPGEEPVTLVILARRYACRACDAILVVLPRGVRRGTRYSLSGIAHALALWGYARWSAAKTREATSAARAHGFTSPDQWSSLRRWTACATALFGAPAGTGTLRERSAKIAAWLASHAPLALGVVPTDAFFGASFVRP